MQHSITAQAQAKEVSQKDTYRLIIFDPAGTGILLESRGSEYRLPKIEIPAGQRIARFITSATKRMWGLDAICLFGSNTEPNNKETQPPIPASYQLLETRNPHWVPPCGFEWRKEEIFLGMGARDDIDAAIAERSLRLAGAYDAGSVPGVFGRRGWVDKLIKWMQPHLNRRGECLTGSYQQFNASPFSTLIRFDTTQGAVWFKAFDPSNLVGFRITPVVAALHPTHVPEVLATHQEWNGLLISDVGGQRLDEASSFDNWRSALSAMACMQLEDTKRTNQLIERGFKDRRFPAVLERIDPFFELMGDVMSRQPNCPPRMLTSVDLRNLATMCKRVCHRLMNSRIPSSLVHGDVGPHNVLISKDGPVFIDWSEASVSHPFLFCEYMLEFAEKGHADLASHKEELRSVYSEPWKVFLKEREISDAFQLTPMVAPFFSALDVAARIDMRANKSSPYDKYLRSLVRLIHRRITEAHAMELA